MNLRAVANRATRGVNPNVAATLYASQGYTTDAAHRQVPAYAAPAPITVQAQALTARELEHLAQMNVQGAERAVFADRRLAPVDRDAQTGGDLLLLPDGWWLVTAMLQDWTMTSGWCKVALTRQLDTAAPA